MSAKKVFHPSNRSKQPIEKRHEDGSYSDRQYQGELAGVQLFETIDITIVMLVLLFGGTALVAIVSRWPDWIAFANVFILAIMAFLVAYRRMVVRPDHLRARQSDRLLAIASEGVTHLRSGLNPETADAVCRIVLRESDHAVAVAITDEEHVLGFAGVGHDHHSAGRPIVTRATKDTINLNQPQILSTKEEIGCPDEFCPLVAAIVVPLQYQSHAVGTLKFYYSDERDLTENELAMAEGLADLLSTQLELNELETQARLARDMELRALQAQINPHFLFNTLNTIGSYIRTDPDTARRLLKLFSQFYRHTLEHGSGPITLGLEIEFMRQYLELEQARFGDKLTLSIEVDDDLLDLPMPSFMLQPIVENSVGHGMREDGSPLHIVISADWMDPTSSRVAICVSDNGRGISRERLATIFDGQSKRGLGMALKNVRDRLSGFYGKDAEFLFDSMEGVGTKVWFRITPPEEWLEQFDFEE